MDAASKFANLPGIAFDQPDCYETSDLPESDQPRNRVKVEDVSANVEILNVEPGEAFKRFQGKSLAVSGTDFSAVPAASRGYQSWGQWELLDKRSEEDETPLQKYRRLQNEVQELQQLFASMKIPADASQPGGSFAGDLRLEDVCEDLKSLGAELKQLDCDSCIDNMIASSASARSLSQLEQALHSAGATSPTASGTPVPKAKSTASDSDAVTYELTCVVDHKQSLTLHQLEERMRALEQLVGSGDKMSLLPGIASRRSICEAIRVLLNRVLLMDPSQLDQLDSRLNSILEKLSSISEKKAGVEVAEREARVSELMQLIKETEGQRSALPAIAARLSRLSEVEEQAIQFSGAISYIDSLQSQITRDLKSSQEDLKTLKESLTQNLSLFKHAVEGFEKRLDAAAFK